MSIAKIILGLYAVVALVEYKNGSAADKDRILKALAWPAYKLGLINSPADPASVPTGGATGATTPPTPPAGQHETETPASHGSGDGRGTRP